MLFATTAENRGLALCSGGARFLILLCALSSGGHFFESGGPASNTPLPANFAGGKVRETTLFFVPSFFLLLLFLCASPFFFLFFLE